MMLRNVLVENDISNENIARNLSLAITAFLNEFDTEVRAFVQEPARAGRLQREISHILNRNTSNMLLKGLRVGIKDIYSVNGLPTRAGSDVPHSVFISPEGYVIRRLREEGAIIVGKTQTSEFAQFEPSETRNPLDLSRTPGASSSGSGAAVAFGLCDFAIGTQAMGSIIRPASYCGIIGLKPTCARIPIDGVMTISPSFDHVGFFTRDFSLCRRVCAALYPSWDTSQYNSLPAVVRVGVPNGSWREKVDDVMLREFDSFVEKLSAASDVQVIRVSGVVDDQNDVLDTCRDLLYAEMCEAHAPWFDEYRQHYSEMAQKVIQEAREMPCDRVKEGRKMLERLRSEMPQRWESAGVDIMIMPAAMGFAPKVCHGTGSPYMNFLWTACGFPALCFPFSWVTPRTGADSPGRYPRVVPPIEALRELPLVSPSPAHPEEPVRPLGHTVVGPLGEVEVRAVLCGQHRGKLPLGLQVVGLPLRDEYMLAVAERLASKVSSDQVS
eukprot:Rmarinus@m.7060